MWGAARPPVPGGASASAAAHDSQNPGADWYLVTPYVDDELIETLQECLDRIPPPTEPVYRLNGGAGALTLQPPKEENYLDQCGQQICTTHKKKQYAAALGTWSWPLTPAGTSR